MIPVQPAMPASGPPAWPFATWVGELDVRDLVGAPERLPLAGAEGFTLARFLLRRGMTVLGFLETSVENGSVATQVLAEQAVGLAAGPSDSVPAPFDVTPHITVVICTRDRAAHLRLALRSLAALDYPDFDVVVVDNAPTTDETAALITAEFDDPRIRRVEEPVAGIARARNTGLRAASGAIVAFTDDDVIVDRHWLTAMAAAFATGDDVLAVSGLVPSGELRSPAQTLFDERVGWSRNLGRRAYRLDAPPADSPLFPFQVSDYGTGANFALRRDEWLQAGGFDTAFGTGTRTGGGEDLDVFLRVLFLGATLVVEPAAVVWHRHRADLEALRHQARSYGRGLGAWVTKVLTDPETAATALRRIPVAAGRLLEKRAGVLPRVAEAPIGAAAAEQAQSLLGAELRRTGRLELLSVAAGPVAYLRQRLAGADVLAAADRTLLFETDSSESTRPLPVDLAGDLS